MPRRTTTSIVGDAVFTVKHLVQFFEPLAVLFLQLLKTAEKIGVKAQYKRAVAGGNDAGAIHKSRSGVRTLAVSLACRYLHAPSCVADKDDCESVFALAKELSQIIAEGRLCNDNIG